jgi:hypothetical protein
LLLALASAVILRSESLRPRNHILLSQIRDSPSLEDQVPVFTSPRNNEAQLYPQELGFLFVAIYDSQGYCGGIRSALHTGLTHCRLGWWPRYITSARNAQNTSLPGIPLLLLRAVASDGPGIAYVFTGSYLVMDVFSGSDIPLSAVVT